MYNGRFTTLKRGDGLTYHRQVRSTSPQRVSLLPTSTTDTDTGTGTSNTDWSNTDRSNRDSSNTDRSNTDRSNRDSSNTDRSNKAYLIMSNKSNTSGRGTQSTALGSNTQGGLTKTQGALSSTRASSTGMERGVRQTDDIPVFDRNKVSLDFPGSLFGPSLSLLIRTTKIVGDVIQNSAVRYQTFLRLFRPLFRGPFEIKGLDPATTTTTTTTTKAPEASDNEVRRR